MPLYITATEVLSNFINADIMTKGIQTEYHEIKVLDFADDTIILPALIGYKKLYENAKIKWLKVNLTFFER